MSRQVADLDEKRGRATSWWLFPKRVVEGCPTRNGGPGGIRPLRPSITIGGFRALRSRTRGPRDFRRPRLGSNAVPPAARGFQLRPLPQYGRAPDLGQCPLRVPGYAPFVGGRGSRLGGWPTRPRVGQAAPVPGDGGGARGTAWRGRPPADPTARPAC